MKLNDCIELIKNDGYGIGIVNYPKHKTVIYSFMKKDSETERTIKFECAKDIAKLLIKNGAKIVYVVKDCVALNFTPQKTDHGMITFWHN